MSSGGTFATNARAASGRELLQEQQRHAVVMQAGRSYAQSGSHWSLTKRDDGRVSLRLAHAEDLAAGFPVAPAAVSELQIDACRDVGALSALAQFTKLEALRLGGLDQISSLEWLPAMPGLQGLRLEGFGSSLCSLQGVERLAQLRALVLDPRGERATLKSLAPLAALAELRLLALPSITTEDLSLKPLAGLQKLELFLGTAYFGPDEYEALALAVPGLRCPWFSDLAWQLL